MILQMLKHLIRCGLVFNRIRNVLEIEIISWLSRILKYHFMQFCHAYYFNVVFFTDKDISLKNNMIFSLALKGVI